jgi:predicted nucleotidyltransferase
MNGDDALAATLTREFPGLVAAYRFGSTVSGQTHRDSDVDVAILTDAPIGATRLFDAKALLEETARTTIDLVDLLAANTVLRMQVISGGVPIVVREERSKALFEDYVFSSYARLNEERREIIERIRREGTVHGG